MICVTFQQPLSRAENMLAYREINGKHVVSHFMHCGEDIGPNHYRFNTIEEARLKYKALKNLVMSRGYTHIKK